jgi:hypothetical protein
MHRLYRLLERRDIAGTRRLVDIGDEAGGVRPEIVDLLGTGFADVSRPPVLPLKYLLYLANYTSAQLI